MGESPPHAASRADADTINNALRRETSVNEEEAGAAEDLVIGKIISFR
ncbi:hypothetical protein IC614_03695 [Allosphingosinicella flava]|uniref:Uncharacterized protein n=1 Tax=Allosphingosinicella flava TaxID=2771430 RepID=A0A7T2GKU1_9SPHN|nr:hypothetical protein [Sphingosinicella flava]QPQ55708.1 hypothetical protein IC614_03695 [Sphingosinicella flava]